MIAKNSVINNVISGIYNFFNNDNILAKICDGLAILENDTIHANKN